MLTHMKLMILYGYQHFVNSTKCLSFLKSIFNCKFMCKITGNFVEITYFPLDRMDYEKSGLFELIACCPEATIPHMNIYITKDYIDFVTFENVIKWAIWKELIWKEPKFHVVAKMMRYTSEILSEKAYHQNISMWQFRDRLLWTGCIERRNHKVSSNDVYTAFTFGNNFVLQMVEAKLHRQVHAFSWPRVFVL